MNIPPPPPGFERKIKLKNGGSPYPVYCAFCPCGKEKKSCGPPSFAFADFRPLPSFRTPPMYCRFPSSFLSPSFLTPSPATLSLTPSFPTLHSPRSDPPYVCSALVIPSHRVIDTPSA